MANIYIIETSTKTPTEVSKGVHVVTDVTKKEAKKNLRNQLVQNGNGNEHIVNVKRLYKAPIARGRSFRSFHSQTSK